MNVPIASPVYTLGAWQGNVIDQYGCVWVVEKEEGWSATPAVRAVAEERTGGDGAWAGPGSFGPRVVTLSGVCICPERAVMLAAKDRAAVVASVRALSDLVVQEAHLTRRCRVRLTDAVDLADKGDRVFSWAFTVTAADPRRYAAESQVVAAELAAASDGRSYPRTYPLVYPAGARRDRVVVRQAGTYDQTPAVIEFRGPVRSPGVYHPQSGRSLVFGGVTLGAADALSVDLGTGTALLNGSASRVGELSAGSGWFMLVPGDNELVFRGEPVGSAGGGPVASMRVVVASAWV